MTNVLISPRKVLSSSAATLISPRKLNITPKKEKDKILNSVKGIINMHPSPTGNLPNIILDGRSPHQKKPVSRCQETGKIKGIVRKKDWLTKMCQQKKHQQPKKLTTKEQQVSSSPNSQKDSLTFYSK